MNYLLFYDCAELIFPLALFSVELLLLLLPPLLFVDSFIILVVLRRLLFVFLLVLDAVDLLMLLPLVVFPMESLDLPRMDTLEG